MNISLIAAISENSCIGKHGELPWHIPEDLQHFKELTLNHTVLMGRKTWESLPERFRPLPNRTNIVITRQTDYAVPTGVLVYTSLSEALRHHEQEEIFIIGGAEMYAQSLPLANTLYITHVHQTVDGDALFPLIDHSRWTESAHEDHPGFSWVTYQRAITV